MYRRLTFDRELYANLLRTKPNGVIVAVGPKGVDKRRTAYTIATERLSRGEVAQVHILCGPPGVRSNFDIFESNSIIIVEDAHLVDGLERTIDNLSPRNNLIVVTGNDVRGSDLSEMVARIEDAFETSDESGTHLVIGE